MLRKALDKFVEYAVLIAVIGMIGVIVNSCGILFNDTENPPASTSEIQVPIAEDGQHPVTLSPVGRGQTSEITFRVVGGYLASAVNGRWASDGIDMIISVSETGYQETMNLVPAN